LRIAVDATLYDPMLDLTQTLGVVPPRFAPLATAYQGGALAQYFAMARGAPGVEALDMSKWCGECFRPAASSARALFFSTHAHSSARHAAVRFPRFDTNYHYGVPELDAASFPHGASFERPLAALRRAQAALAHGADAATAATAATAAACPVLIGPVTFVDCAVLRGVSAGDMVARLVPTYADLIRALAAAGATEVQLHEPSLAKSGAASDVVRAATEAAYGVLCAAADAAGCSVNLVIPYDDPGECYPWLVALPVAALTLDFCGAPGAAEGPATLGLLRAHGFPAGKRLCAGVVSGRSVWADAAAPHGQRAADVLAALLAAGVAREQLWVAPSCSLHHVPYDLDAETALPDALTPRLAFATQKLRELSSLAASLDTLPPRADAAPDQRCAPGGGAEVRVDAALTTRAEPYETRRAKQLRTPPFPTSTIGSFPQTPDIRRLRARLAKGALTRAEYEREIDKHIAFAVGAQEGLGLDVLVHGESERTDMVRAMRTRERACMRCEQRSEE
jgi:5-methyltetrahydropteroyltriglutamate--homocysteine methyltransferase